MKSIVLIKLWLSISLLVAGMILSWLNRLIKICHTKAYIDQSSLQDLRYSCPNDYVRVEFK